jgi:phage baseplate assembly protein W
MSTAAPADFGTDLSCTVDLTDDMDEVEGIHTLAQAVYRRLYTPRGSLWQDPHYGLDLRAFMSRALTQHEIATLPGDVANEIQKDERIQRAAVQVVSATLFEIVLSITLTTAAGPFALTISATQAAVTLTSVRGA